MKKILAVLLTVIMMISLSACYEKDNEEGDSSSSFVEVTSVTESTENLSSETENEQSAEEESSDEEKPVFSYTKYEEYKEIKYVALGDSIARGYGLEDPVGKSYPALIANALSTTLSDATVNFTNYGVDGLTTDGLIRLMNEGCEALDGADLITVCIGANNMLGTFLSVVEKHYSDFIPAEEQSGISGEISENASLINGVKAIEAELESEEFAAKMQEGIDKLREHYPLIINELKRRAPAAEIVFMTVYSPYHGIDLSLPYLDISLNMGEISDKWVSAMNDVIKEIVTENGCTLVETYDVFEEKGGLVNAEFSILSMRFNFDPHPNLFGHIELANMHLRVIGKE